MQLYFIRHAQSTNNALYAETGSERGRSSDPGLTPLGKQQALRLAHYLAGHNGSPPASMWDQHHYNSYPFTHLYTSLMVRAIHTGHALAEAISLPLLAWPELHERGGIFEEDVDTGESVGLPGQGRSFFQQHFPRLVLPAELTESGWWGSDRESTDEMVLRAAAVLAELLARHGHTEDRVALISHGGFYQAFLAVLLGYQMQTASVNNEATRVWFALNNTGITRVDFGDDHIRLVFLNRLDHLPAHMVT